jgi:hypothetical protein
MTDRHSSTSEDRKRSGRRLAVDIDAPRDRTVCFMVSEDERVAIDSLADSVSRTRSSLLVRIVNAFMKDAGARAGADNVLELLQQVRTGVLPRETSTKRH